MTALFIAGALAMAISLIGTRVMITVFRNLGRGQPILGKEDRGPEHQHKAGTPTMGGLLMLTAIAVPVLLCGNFHNKQVWVSLLTTLWLGGLGFLDDWLRVVKKLPKGLLGRYKLIGQFSIGAIVGICVLVWPEPNTNPTLTHVPFLKSYYFDLGLLFVPFVMLTITGASNAVNLTDGLDGLASGLVAIAAIAFAGMCYLTGHIKFSAYLNTGYLPFAGELTVFCAAVLGAALGFLWYNCHPADVFMGDTGSLSLGGALGVVAVLIKREFWLVLVGGVFVAEALSVMVQVTSFKLTGKRVLRMSPLHHHFELIGWPESRVVLRFYIAGALLALLSLSTFKLQ